METGKDRMIKRERMLCTSPYATLSDNSKGRVRKIEPDQWRTEFQRDIHRIIYSQPFRRLKHKTQVFYAPYNDHISTRLEHAIHVASAARTIARSLELNEDLAEAIGLAHDLGHAPFGHHGEDALKDICTHYGILPVFQHEIHGLRVVDLLGKLDREPSGLNLTYEVRDGIISHCGEDRDQRIVKPYNGEKILGTIIERNSAGNATTLEGCIVRLVDKVAYAGRDLEDGIHARLIEKEDVPRQVGITLGNNNGEITGRLIEDIIINSRGQNYIAMSDEKFECLKELINFNYERIYGHERVIRYKDQAEDSLKTLFALFLDALKDKGKFEALANRNHMEGVNVFSVLRQFISDIGYSDTEPEERIVLDFISGFTDSFVFLSIRQLLTPKLIT